MTAWPRVTGPPNVSIMAARGDEAAQAEMAAVRAKYGLPAQRPLLHEVRAPAWMCPGCWKPVC
jgi:hypothetical protein